MQFLVQLKVKLKSDFLKCQKLFLYQFEIISLQIWLKRHQTEKAEFQMEIFGFSSKSSENMIFRNFKSYSCTCIFLKGIHFQKCGCRGIRQNWFSISVQSHMKIVCFFLKCQKLFLYLFEMNSLQKLGLEPLDRNR